MDAEMKALTTATKAKKERDKAFNVLLKTIKKCGSDEHPEVDQARTVFREKQAAHQEAIYAVSKLLSATYQ